MRVTSAALAAPSLVLEVVKAEIAKTPQDKSSTRAQSKMKGKAPPWAAAGTMTAGLATHLPVSAWFTTIACPTAASQPLPFCLRRLYAMLLSPGGCPPHCWVPCRDGGSDRNDPPQDYDRRDRGRDYNRRLDIRCPSLCCHRLPYDLEALAAHCSSGYRPQPLMPLSCMFALSYSSSFPPLDLITNIKHVFESFCGI